VADKLSPAVFLDRDGTIMRDVDYCGDPKDVDVFVGVTAALRKLKNRGYKVFIITNQSGIARGYFTKEQYHAVEREVLRQVGENLIDATYMCPDKPNSGSKRRKPSPEMILEAARDHGLDLVRSFFIGDKESDMKSGRNAGVKTILVRTGYGTETDERLADLVARDLNDAVDMILNANE
jgi:D-glycero-D-manno-heptose 1,7-bisphosphate phosphatase